MANHETGTIYLNSENRRRALEVLADLKEKEKELECINTVIEQEGLKITIRKHFKRQKK